MATTATTKKSAAATLPLETQAMGELQRFWMHLQENLLVYLVILLVAALAAVLGAAYNLSSRAAEKQVMTAYAEAMQEEDAARRAAALEPLAQGRGRWALEAAYMLGETAIELGDYKKAQAAFTRIMDQAIDSEYAPGARQGLAFIAEATGDFQNALDGYEEIVRRWPDSFLAHIQHLNIGRMREALGDFAGAKAAYERQVQEFEGSRTASKAQAALDRLKESHPELFTADSPAAAELPAEGGQASAPAASVSEPVVDGAAAPASASVQEAAPVEAAPAATSEPSPAAAAPAGEDFEDLPTGNQISGKPVI
jgi:predicted negative regulator of RcsB-dependent stress response